MVSGYFLSAAEAQQANISTTRIFIMALEIHTICTFNEGLPIDSTFSQTSRRTVPLLNRFVTSVCLVRFLPLFVPLSIIFRWLLIWTYHYTICKFSCDNPFIANQLFYNNTAPVFNIFKGTVSRDGFGFWWHVWIVLGLNRGAGPFLKFFRCSNEFILQKCISGT